MPFAPSLTVVLLDADPPQAAEFAASQLAPASRFKVLAGADPRDVPRAPWVLAVLGGMESHSHLVAATLRQIDQRQGTLWPLKTAGGLLVGALLAEGATLADAWRGCGGLGPYALAAAASVLAAEGAHLAPSHDRGLLRLPADASQRDALLLGYGGGEVLWRNVTPRGVCDLLGGASSGWRKAQTESRKQAEAEVAACVRRVAAARAALGVFGPTTPLGALARVRLDRRLVQLGAAEATLSSRCRYAPSLASASVQPALVAPAPARRAA